MLAFTTSEVVYCARPYNNFFLVWLRCGAVIFSHLSVVFGSPSQIMIIFHRVCCGHGKTSLNQFEKNEKKTELSWNKQRSTKLKMCSAYEKWANSVRQIVKMNSVWHLNHVVKFKLTTQGRNTHLVLQKEPGKRERKKQRQRKVVWKVAEHSQKSGKQNMMLTRHRS